MFKGIANFSSFWHHTFYVRETLKDKKFFKYKLTVLLTIHANLGKKGERDKYIMSDFIQREVFSVLC